MNRLEINYKFQVSKRFQEADSENALVTLTFSAGPILKDRV